MSLFELFLSDFLNVLTVSFGRTLGSHFFFINIEFSFNGSGIFKHVLLAGGEVGKVDSIFGVSSFFISELGNFFFSFD
jgi:hypothetical protein